MSAGATAGAETGAREAAPAAGTRTGAEARARRVPSLPRGVRLERDGAAGGFLLLAPERVFALDGPAAAVIAAIDGRSSIAAIAAALAARYGAPVAKVEADITAMVERLAARRVIDLQGEP